MAKLKSKSTPSTPPSSSKNTLFAFFKRSNDSNNNNASGDSPSTSKKRNLNGKQKDDVDDDKERNETKKGYRGSGSGLGKNVVNEIDLVSSDSEDDSKKSQQRSVKRRKGNPTGKKKPEVNPAVASSSCSTSQRVIDLTSSSPPQTRKLTKDGTPSTSHQTRATTTPTPKSAIMNQNSNPLFLPEDDDDEAEEEEDRNKVEAMSSSYHRQLHQNRNNRYNVEDGDGKRHDDDSMNEFEMLYATKDEGLEEEEFGGFVDEEMENQDDIVDNDDDMLLRSKRVEKGKNRMIEIDEDEDEEQGVEQEEDEDELTGDCDQYEGEDNGRGRAAGDENKVIICPICNKDLKVMKEEAVQLHVNQCLDSSFSSAPFPNPSTLKNPSSSTNTKFKSQSNPPVAPEKANTTARLGPPSSNKDDKPNAFTALMLGHAEEKAWKEAERMENDRKKNNKKKGGKTKVWGNGDGKMIDGTGGNDPQGKGKGKVEGKMEIRCPFYKIMEGMEIAVDAFRYGKVPGVKAYFLTHAHSDHYTNLRANWNHGMIYCSKTTANLIKAKLGVKDEWITSLPMDQTVEVEGIKVTLIDANHCPGSVLFLFEGPHTSPSSTFSRGDPPKIFRYLHCGDFRASPQHINHPAIKGKKIDIVYLDTTYCDPKYTFPSQALVIKACADMISQRVKGDSGVLHRGGPSRDKQERMLKGWLATPNGTFGGPNTSKTLKTEEEKNGFKPLVPGLEAKVEEEDYIPEASTSEMRIDSPKSEDVGLEGEMKSQFEGEKHVSTLHTAGANISWEDQNKPVKTERILIVVGTYSIGKERLVKGIARAIDSKIWTTKAKADIFQCMEDPELHSMLTRDPLKAQVHVTNLFDIKREALEDYLASFKGYFSNIIALRPTGWTYKGESSGQESIPSIFNIIQRGSKRTYSSAWFYPSRDSTAKIENFGVPYSEHSSFFELTCFCVSLNHVRTIATVNIGNEVSRNKQKKWFERWDTERKRRQDAREADVIPYRGDDYW